jgi:predicted nuclease of predicted toxin-antitoxin system
MRILVDENIPKATAEALRRLGHDIRDIRGTSHEGISDDELWTIAQRDGRLLITTDRGFSTRRHGKHSGVLIVRLKQPNRSKIHSQVLGTLARFTEEEWPGLVVIVRDRALSVWHAHEDR